MTSTVERTDLRARLQLALGPGYAVGEELTGGGMSRVFEARDVTLNRDIVVKTLPPEMSGDISVERFKREIHFAASLQHPHIVPVHAAGDVDGLPYYTMPRVEGESLRHRLGRVQRFSVTEALSVVRDIGRALAYAHRRGLVHRDIKPENVLVSDGVAVVTDFGIAKAVAASRVDEPASPGLTIDTPTGLTATGTSMGTPNYMAPEQAAGDPRMDHRVDLYSLGVVAYELLCGTAPFADRSRREQMAAQLVERPRDIAELRLDIPPGVSRLVMQCLEKEPDGRPASADEIVREVDAAITGAPAIEPVGDDPTVIRKAFGWYAVAFVAATAIAWLAMDLIGLPDWVLPGTIVIMALGLPLVALTALTRYAAFQSSTGMLRSVSSGGWLFTPTDRTLRVAQALTWKRVMAGGGVSLGAFGVLIAGFMTTRALGIGPAASLLSKGQITRHQPIIIADFSSAPADSLVARMAREAASIGFQQSNIVSVMAPDAVADGLRRMRRDPSEPLSVETARQLAARNGISVIAAGEIVRHGPGFLVALRLIAADSGQVLETHQATVMTVPEVLSTANDLTRGLRSRLGESLKRVRETPALENVTTSSFEALGLYSQAIRLADREGDNQQAWALLTRALEIDSTFAAAWRKLYIVTGYMSSPPRGGPTRREILEAAFRHRSNASDNERQAIEGQYYWTVANDRQRSIAAYQAIAVRTGRPENNHAWFLLPHREFARAESLYRILFARGTASQAPYNGIVWALMNQGKHDAADSVVRVARERFPNLNGPQRWSTDIKCGRHDIAACTAGYDSLAAESPRSSERIVMQSELAFANGRLRRGFQLMQQVERLLEESSGRDARRAHLQKSAWAHLTLRHSAAQAIAALDSFPRPVGVPAARLYAEAGQLDSARSIITTLEAQRDTNPPGPALLQAKAALASADGRFEEALRLFRRSDRHRDGSPYSICVGCVFLDVGSVFDRAGQRDSAIVFYQRFLDTPVYNPSTADGGPWSSRFDFRWWSLVNKAWIHERLGALYEQTGERQKAIAHLQAFADLWKDADPELQPRVVAARNRIAQLRAL